MVEELQAWWIERGLNPVAAAWLAVGAVLAALALVAFLVDRIARRVVLKILGRVVRRSALKWDDALLEQKFLDRLVHLAPAWFVYAAAPRALAGADPAIASTVRTLASVYMVVLGMAAVSAFLNAAVDVYRRVGTSKSLPITGFAQVVKIVLFVLGGLWIVSMLVGKSPLALFGGIGAMSAVLLLVFKDSLLGFVAGIQIAANDMVRRGDWIELPKYGVDGDVLDVTLTTVVVQNWDKTIATVPAYALVSDTFRNWRGMSESGGRRIKRAVHVDMTSIRFCDEEMLERFRKIQYIAEYLDRKLDEVREFNRTHDVDEAVLVNGRRLTNVGTFRAYLEAYLRHHPQIHRDMTFLVRQLAPTSAGLPIEIYVFSRDQNWARYEGIQADIFDHVLAVVPLFDLRVFQEPTGADVRALAPAAAPA